ncbi:hypothetical protein DVB69_12045 [Sporosarcina sp. BI001-red]|uniref:ABC transporter permease n=1 Tax=Sporosarcina sp. BI001-red TaxID=2282866 RepID=UPI000E27A79C|nr:ABC transporter permease [Sporosarcina sp. BI001-red]REB06431.1 hypothetical protein DVB69_12045 [Sporosarcina sp. BI001-red]
MKTSMFEWKKIRRLKLFVALAAATFLLITGMYIHNVVQQDLIPAKKIEYFSKFLTEVSQQNDTDQQTLQKSEDPETKMRLEIGMALVGALKELQDAIENREGNAELSFENTVYQIATEYKSALGTFSLSQKEMDHITQVNQELKKRNLIKEDFDLSIAQPLFMKKVTHLLLSPVGFLIATLLIGNAFTKEWDDKSMQFNRVLPVSSAERIIGRLFSYWLASFVWLIIIYGISFSLPYAGGRTEQSLFSYPFANSNGQFNEAGGLLVNSGIYSVLFLLFSFTIFLLVGSMLRNAIITVLLVSAVFIGGWIVTSVGVISVWDPFTYQQPIQVAEQQKSLSPISLLILSGLSIVGTILACIADKRRALS